MPGGHCFVSKKNRQFGGLSPVFKFEFLAASNSFESNRLAVALMVGIAHQTNFTETISTWRFEWKVEWRVIFFVCFDFRRIEKVEDRKQHQFTFQVNSFHSSGFRSPEVAQCDRSLLLLTVTIVGRSL